jgi:uncharacterized DUF497 family protein
MLGVKGVQKFRRLIASLMVFTLVKSEALAGRVISCRSAARVSSKSCATSASLNALPRYKSRQGSSG